MADFDLDEFFPEVSERDDLDEVDDETSFIDDPAVPLLSGEVANGVQASTSGLQASLEQELLQSAVDDYYNAQAKRGFTPATGRDYTKFILDKKGRLCLKAHPDFEIVNRRNGTPLALSTLAGRGGSNILKNELGFIDSVRKQKLPTKTLVALKSAKTDLDRASAAVGGANLPDLAEQARKASDTVHEALSEADINQILGTIGDPPLVLREIRGLDKALQRTRGELTNNLAKLSELDKHIALERQKLNEDGIDEFARRRIAERLLNLEDERSTRLEAAAANREALRSQINRIQETIGRVLNEDTTLADRIRTLFREQGITIASILTAIGFIVSTLVLAVTGEGTGGPAPTPAPPEPSKAGLKEWVKKHLAALSRALAKLAEKAAAALPGIIGSIVSWLLNFFGKTASWLVDNLWALVIAVGGLLYIAVQDWLS